MVGRISEDPLAAGLGGTESLAGVQGGGNVRITPALIAAFLQGQFVQILSRQSGGDTNNSSSGSGSYKDHNLTYSVPANFLTANKGLRVTAQYKMTTGSAAPNLTNRLTLGGVTLAESILIAPSTSMVNMQATVQFDIQALAAPSASSAVEAGILGAANGVGGAGQMSQTATPVNLATNGALVLAVGTKWASAGTGTNTIQLVRLTVEAL